MKVLFKIFLNHVGVFSLNLFSFCAGFVKVKHGLALNVQLSWLQYSKAINRLPFASPAVGNDCSRCCPLLEICTLLLPKYFFLKISFFCYVFFLYSVPTDWSASILLKSEVFIRSKEIKPERYFWFISLQPV